LGRDLGIAGMIGRAEVAGLEAFGVRGVVSPGAGIDGGCAEEGVVGSVDSVCSEAGWVVEGVSGRGTEVSASIVSSLAVPSPWWIFGSSTGSAESRADCFFFRRARLGGKGKSGLDSQGNCVMLARSLIQILSRADPVSSSHASRKKIIWGVSDSYPKILLPLPESGCLEERYKNAGILHSTLQYNLSSSMIQLYLTTQLPM
jgi:hypothetical protein